MTEKSRTTYFDSLVQGGEIHGNVFYMALELGQSLIEFEILIGRISMLAL